MKLTLFIRVSISVLIAASLFQCDDIVKDAILNAGNTVNPPVSYYTHEVSGFTATQSFESTDMTLSWTNPTDSAFSRVVIMRKAGSYPTGINDTSANIVYSGTTSPYVDVSLTPNYIYYYMAYAKDTSSTFSKGVGVFNEVIPVEPGEPTGYGYEAIGFTATQVPDTTTISLSWTNPTDTNFERMIILRKTDIFPTSYDDATATFIYSGSTSPYLDEYLTIGTTYCYAIYAKSKNSKYSSGRMQSEEMVIAPTPEPTDTPAPPDTPEPTDAPTDTPEPTDAPTDTPEPTDTPAPTYYAYDVTDFLAAQGSSNREIVLTWINPDHANFASIKLLRKTSDFPTGPDDGTAAVLYTGTNQRYTDSDKTPSTTYYYAIYATDTLGIPSPGVLATKTVTETTSDIRRRSFYIIGGSGNYPTNPQTNLITAVEMFDPVLQTVTTVATLPVGRYFCDVASVNGKIYVFGGFNSTGSPVTTVDILDVDILLWATGTVLPGSPGPPERAALRVAEWNNKIYTICGTNTANAAGGQIDGRRYDPLFGAGGTWLTDNENIYKNLTTQRVNLAAEAYNGSIYYCGGVGTTGLVVNSGYCYNILSNTEVSIGAGNTNYGCTSVMYHKILDSGADMTVMFLIGGGTAAASTGIPHPSFTNFNNNVIYMLQLPSWGTSPTWVLLTGSAQSLITNRAYAGAEYSGDYIYIFGGIIQTNAISTIEKLNVNNGNPNTPWSLLSSVSRGAPRYGFGITKVNY